MASASPITKENVISQFKMKQRSRRPGKSLESPIVPPRIKPSPCDSRDDDDDTFLRSSARSSPSSSLKSLSSSSDHGSSPSLDKKLAEGTSLSFSVFRRNVKYMLGVTTVLIFIHNSSMMAPLPNAANTNTKTRRFLSDVNVAEAKEKSTMGPHNSFSIQTANPDDISTVRCGNLKCFITFENGVEETNNVGYVVAQDNRTESGTIGFESRLDDAWMIASHIHNNYNLSTLLLGPSETILKDEPFVDSLNNKLIHHAVPNRKIQRFSAKKPLMVQKSLVMPEPNYFWHYQVSVVTKKLLNVDSIYSNFVETIKDGDQFIETLQKDINATKEMLRDDNYPCLLKDFQLVIDLKGRIHHIDLDRCFDEHQEHPRKDTIISFIDTLGKKYTLAVEELRQR